jgi:hypothetical protein
MRAILFSGNNAMRSRLLDRLYSSSSSRNSFNKPQTTRFSGHLSSPDTQTPKNVFV